MGIGAPTLFAISTCRTFREFRWCATGVRKLSPRWPKRTLEIEVTSDPLQILRSPDVDIVAVVTPVWTHFELAKAALENGKHVFVEKPFTATSEQAEELIELAERKNLKIMVDHTFLFTGAVRKIKQLIDAGRTRGSLLLRHHAGESGPVSARRRT